VATIKIDTKTIVPIIATIILSAFGWVFNSIEEIKSHQNACDAMVMEINSELDMLESNFTELLFKLNG
jgi:heme/copper-type cytochrome/quinol oxidase subunit 2